MPTCRRHPPGLNRPRFRSAWLRAAAIGGGGRCTPGAGPGARHSPHRRADYPGVLSAAGLLSAPIEHEVSAAFQRNRREIALAGSHGDARQPRCGLRRADARRERIPGAHPHPLISPISAISASRITSKSPWMPPIPTLRSLYRDFSPRTTVFTATAPPRRPRSSTLRTVISAPSRPHPAVPNRRRPRRSGARSKADGGF